jgi:hypothetical protein
MSKYERPYQCKGIVNNGQVLIKDIDTQEGRIQGYFAIFGNVDSDGDMIVPGAFKKTLSEDIGRIKHLLQHNPWQPLSSTKSGLQIKEDKKGLYFDSVISKTSWGKDTIQLYADQVIDEHSIGYEVIREEKKSGYNELQQLKLWEGSSVTWGANENALVTGIKSMTKEQQVDRMNHLMKAIRNGRYENEEIYDMLEIYFKQLQTSILSLTPTSTPAASRKEAPEPQLESEEEEALFIKAKLQNTLLKLKLS